MKYIIFFINVCFCTIIFGQEQQTDCANAIVIKQKVDNLRIYKYPEGSRAEKLDNYDKVKNTSPEELMSSVLSAVNIEWYNYNRESKKKNTTQNFDYIIEADPKTYYAELLYKTTFSANGEEFAILKYYLHDNQKPLLGYAEAMKNIEGKWVTTTEAQVSQFLFFMIMIDTKYIDHIFNNTESDNSSLNRIMGSNISNESIDINGVMNELEIQLAQENSEIKSILDPNRLFK